MKSRITWCAVVTLGVCLFLGGAVFAQGKVDLNTATVEQLKSLQGIGETRAQAIVKYRQMHGPFQSLDDLKNVPGIGSKIVESNASVLTLGPGGTQNAKQGMSTKAEKAKQGVTEQDKQGLTQLGQQAPPKSKKATTQTEKAGEKAMEKIKGQPLKVK